MPAELHLYVSGTYGQDAADRGSSDKPVATIQAALALAAGAPTAVIKVALGRYDGTVRLRSGIRLEGGYHDDFTRAPLTEEDLGSDERHADLYAERCTVLVGKGTAPVVLAERLSGQRASLSNVVLVGVDLDGKSTGESSCVIIVSAEGQAAAPSFSLERVKIIAGLGANGRAGTSPRRRVDDVYSAGGGAGAPAQTQRGKGRDGVSGQSSYGDGVTVSGGRGGAGGDGHDTVFAFSADTGPGADGERGKKSPSRGRGGSANEDVIGWFDNAWSWIAPCGGSGNDGCDGSGGGGGGAGGARAVVWPVWNVQDVQGGRGGDGGRGGRGGLGGEGGGPGGGSFALTIRDAHVDVGRVVIMVGRGGLGGSGGLGENGHPGEGGRDGADGTLTTNGGESKYGGKGGRGGDGGAGAQGGDGAGGCGGPAIGIVLLGKAKLVYGDHSDLEIAGGTAGIGGGGASRGKAGVVTDVRPFDTK